MSRTKQCKKSTKLDTKYLSDLQCRHMWKKVISDEKTKEDKIIHYSLKIYSKRRVNNVQIVLQVLSQYPDVEELPKATYFR